jgi:hypothetical protein
MTPGRRASLESKRMDSGRMDKGGTKNLAIFCRILGRLRTRTTALFSSSLSHNKLLRKCRRLDNASLVH